MTTGTIFADTHLPLLKWFAAVYLLGESRKGMSANQLKRMLGVSYKTAWYLCHRIRAAMKEAARREPPGGVVEVDETNVSAKRLLAYLDEMSFRFNRRHDSDWFVETLRYMVSTDPLRFADLIK